MSTSSLSIGMLPIVLRRSEVCWLEHVHKQPLDRDAAYRLTEEQFLDGVRADGLERWKHEQQFAEAERLCRVGWGDVLVEGQLGLVL